MVADETNIGDASRASPPLQAATSALGAAIVIAAVLWAADVPRMFGIVAYTEQFLALELGLALALSYLRVPARGASRRHLPWYDGVAAVAALALGGFLALRYGAILDQATARPLHLVLIGVALVLLLLEALRRVVGLPLVLIVATFLLYALFGDLLPGKLAGRPITFTRLAVYLGIDANAILGMPLIVGTIVVIPFILMGQMLGKSGGSEFFTDIAVGLVGRYRGGSAKIAVGASALFGTISGSAVANVMADGVVTIPLMRRSGYPAVLAAAIEAVASTGGQLVPPVMGAAAFLMAEFLQVSYGAICLAAIVPALLYYAAIFIHVDLEAARNGITAVKGDGRSAWRILAQGWHVLLPFAVLVGALFFWNMQPEAAMLLALVPLAASGMLIGYKGQRLRWRQLWPVLASAGAASLDMILICAAAGIVIGVLNLSGLSFSLTMLLVALGQGSLLLLLVAAAVISLILGMGMPTVGVYVLVATLVAPAMVEMGIDPLAAHMFVFYFGMMSMITPPVALAAYAAASLAGCDAMKAGWAACKVAWSAFLLPFLFVLSPTLILKGEPLDVVLAVATALGGVWLVSAGMVGHARGPLGRPTRAAFIVAGLLLLMPANAFPGAVWTDMAGLILGAALLLLRAPARRPLAAKTEGRG